VRKTLAKFERKDPPPILFMKGDEPYFRYALSQSMKKHFRSVGYEVEDVDGDDIGEDALLDVLDQINPFTAGKLVVVRNAEKIKDKKGKLQGYVDEPTERVVVVFDANGEPKNKLSEALAAKAVVFESKAFKTFGTEIENWIQEEAANRGKSLSPDQARVIRTHVGTNLFTLRNAVKKVALHADGRAVADDDLRAVLMKTTGSQTYEFTNAFGEKNLKKAFSILDNFYRVEDDPALILSAALTNFIERMIKAKSLLAYKLERKDVANLLGMNPYVFQNSLEPMLKNFDMKTLIDAMCAMCEIDIQLKNSSLDKRTLIENLLTRFLDRESK
jgi:DNA polymerase III delta subunit